MQAVNSMTENHQYHTTNITKIHRLSEDAFVFYFQKLFSFKPGEVVALTLHQQEPARLYSICSGVNESDLAILFKVKPDGFLTPRLAQKTVGDLVFMSKPFGAFYGTQNSDYWIAAGTGIAPFHSMTKSGLAQNKTLIYGGREPGSFYFHEVFKNIDGLNYIPCSSTLKQDGFYEGRLTAYLKSEPLDIRQNFFLCGSAEMVVQSRDVLIDRGVKYENIISEIYF